MLRRMFSVSLLTLLLIASGVMFIGDWQATAAQKDKNERGRQLFVRYCASCHGVDAKGNGPAADALKKTPANLTQIPKQDGKFPALRVKRVIGGDDIISGHGSREMPIWGTIFREQRDRTMAIGNIYALTIYIESIQAK